MIHPYYAAKRDLVDDVIDPAETRSVLIRTMAMLRSKLPGLADYYEPWTYDYADLTTAPLQDRAMHLLLPAGGG